MPKYKLGPKSRASTKLSGAADVALVVTVFNEEENILRLLDEIKKQTLIPREVIIVDGGSTDKTFSLLRDYAQVWNRLRVYQIKGNRSVGRNYGVSRSSAPLITFTDAGCYPDSDWLQKLIRPFSDPSVQVVSGYYRGHAADNFQKCLIPYVLVMPDRADKSEFYPSTRSMALRRTVWNRSGGFDIRLSHNEDYAYAHWLKKMGYSFTFVPDALVNWLPRKNLSASFWMFLRFALGDIQSGIFRPQVKRLIIRFIIFVFIFSLSLEVPSFFILLTILVLTYLLWSISKNYRYVRHVSALFWLPIIQLSSDIAILMGTIIGLLSKS